MSLLKQKKIFIVFIMVLFSMLLFGCKNNVAVESIYFNIEAEDSISLLVGETFTPQISFNPTYPTNTKYELITSDSSILAVNGNAVTAKKAGSAILNVVSNDNELIRDYVVVNVREEQMTLPIPLVEYNSAQQLFVISAVDNAAGYTIKINSEEIDVGNINKYSLNDYANHILGQTVQATDKILSVSVRANAPRYTQAYASSNYSTELKIYQAGEVENANIKGGVLTFNTNPNVAYSVFLQGECINDNALGSVDLTNLNSNYLDFSNVQVGVKAVVKDDVRINDVTYYDSKVTTLNATVMAVANVNIVGTTLSWQNVVGAEKYEVHFDGELLTTTTSNSLNLAEVENFNVLTNNLISHNIVVKTVMLKNVENLVKTVQNGNTITLTRLQQPNVTATNNLISWNAVAGADCYAVSISYEENAEPVNILTTTTGLSINLTSENFPCGTDYNVEVVSLFTKESENGVSYLSSATSSVAVHKQSEVEAVISEYILHINAEIGERYLIKYSEYGELDPNIAELPELKERNVTLTAESTDLQHSIETCNFKVGKNVVEVWHLGNNAEKFDSCARKVEFTQLALPSVNIQNKTATISVDPENDVDEWSKLAQFHIKVFNNDNLYESVGTTYAFNTTDRNADDFLAAGTVEFLVFAVGDKSSTFTYRINGSIWPLEMNDLKVLAAPTITVKSADEATLMFNAVEDAIDYKITGLEENDVVTSETSVNFNILAGETKTVQIQAEGNNSKVFSSAVSEPISVTKLNTPTMEFNNATNVINKIDDNNSEIVKAYELKLNGELAHYDFASAFTGFAVGNNTLNLRALAINSTAKNFYLNSGESDLIVNKIDEQSTFTLNSNNQLVIAPNNQHQEHGLQLTLTIGEIIINFESENGVLKSSEYELPYTYQNNSYTIPLLNNQFEPLIDKLTQDFLVAVKYKAALPEQTQFASSEISDAVEIFIAPKSNFNMETRDEQFVVFNKLQATNTYSDFGLLVNNSYVLNLSDDVVVDETNLTFKVDIGYIYSNVPQESLLDVNKLEIISFNTKSAENNLVLSAKNDVLYVALAPSVELTSSKNNNAENKSQIISFLAETLSYEVKYVIEVADETNTEQLILTSSNIVDGAIKFNLDDYTSELNENATVSGKVHTTGTFQDGKDVHMFNSKTSNILNFVKLNNVQNVDVNNGILCFDAVENAVGYDIFKNIAGGLERIAFIAGTSYDLASQTGDINIQIRAISAEDGQTNSSLCEVVQISKLATPILSVESGKIALTLSDEAAELLNATTFTGEDESFENSDGAMIYYANDINSGYLALTTDGVSISGNQVTIEPALVLNFGVGELLLENLTFAIKVNKSSLGKFINSNSASFGVYGLFAPTSISKTSNFEGENEVVENITWVSSTKNVLQTEDLTSGYIVKIKTETSTTPHLTSDANLKYLNKLTGEILAYPSVITANSIPFPYAYDNNKNGTIESEEIFGVGTYVISVQTLPKVVSGWNLASSKFSTEYTLKLLATPELTSNDGAIVWGENKDATSYLVKVYDRDGTYLDTENVTNNMFDFSSTAFDSYKGIYQIEVQAISNKTNVVKSAVSNRMFVYRMPEAESLIVDDGNLVLYANKYFNTAVLDFVDTETMRVQTLIYSRNEEAGQVLNNLNIENWGAYTGDVNSLLASERFVVRIADTEILNLMLGRSYRINVRLVGNGGINQVVVSSKTTYAIRSTTTTKLNATLMEVDKGILTFNSQSEYTGVNLNYNFNNQEIAGIHNFFGKTAIYAISITANGTKHNMYAVDYANFASAVQDGTLVENTDYVALSNMGDLVAYVKFPHLVNGTTEYLYLNVFNNNSFNLRDNEFLYYYSVNKTYVYNEFDGVATNATINNILVSTSTTYQSINIGNGGSFVVEVCLMGGDEIAEATTSAYINSNLKTSNTFIRYGNNVLSSSAGKLMLQNMISKNENGQVIDTPVYELTVKSVAGENVKKVYLYHSTEEEARQIVNNPDAIYELVEIEYEQVEPETQPRAEAQAEPTMQETGYLLFDFSKHFEAGTYVVNIRTLAGMGIGIESENYLLDSKIPTSDYVYKKISESNIVASDGVLEFNLGYIVNDTSLSYIYNYEVTITDELNAEYVHTINGASSGVTIDEENHKIKYILPNEINCGEQTLIVENSKEYSIKVKGMAQDKYIVNATYPKGDGQDECLTFAISSGVETSGENQVKINNGRLEWKVKDINNYNGVEINLNYLDDNGEDKTVKIVTSGQRYDLDGNYVCHYYNFSDMAYPIQGTDSFTILGSEKEYELTMFVRGTWGAETAILNSNVTTALLINRLNKVNANSIMSQDGKLVWDAVEGAVEYEVVVYSAGVQFEFTSGTTELDFLTALSINEESLPAGSYAIKIRAIGSDDVSSIISNEASGFKKLPVVAGIGVDETDRNFISWQPVADAQGYQVVFEFGGNIVSEIINDGTTKCQSPSNLVGEYQVSVSAIGFGQGKVFNGNPGTFTSSKAVPQPVGRVAFDAENYRYFFPVSSDFTGGDKIRITYNFRPYIVTNGVSNLSEETSYKIEQISYMQQGAYFTSETGEINYFFVPSEMGAYENFTVQVEREGALYSAGSQAGDVDFALYATGNGTNESPYGILNSTHLINIKHKPNAKFKLYSSVNMASVNPLDVLTSAGNLISDEFTGVLDGAGYRIYGLEGNKITLSGATNFALFGNLNGAVIKNLVVGNEENSIIITNMFASNNSNVIKLSLIATTATDSTFEDVTVSGVKFIIGGAGVLKGAVYVAGYLATATNSTFAGCTANVDVQFDADFTSSTTYIAGMVASANKISIKSNESERKSGAKFSLTQQKINRVFGYVGGMVGYLGGEYDNENYGIFGANVETIISSNVYASHLGGIVGYVSNSNITNCLVTGEYTHTALTGTQNIGGVAGTAQSANIANCTVQLTFHVAISNGSGIKIGAVAGYLTTVNNRPCNVDGCQIAYDFTTQTILTSNGIGTIGIYGGSSGTNITVSGCQKYQGE